MFDLGECHKVWDDSIHDWKTETSNYSSGGVTQVRTYYTIDFSRVAIELSGLNVKCTFGANTTILSGWIGWSEIHHNHIRYCGYFYNSLAKEYQDQNWYMTRYSITSIKDLPSGIDYNPQVDKPNCGIWRVTRIYNNQVSGVSISCFKGRLIDSYIYNNYFTGAGGQNSSQGQFIGKIFFYDGSNRAQLTNTVITNNYIDFFYTVYNLTSGARLISANNTYDIAAVVFDCNMAVFNPSDVAEHIEHYDLCESISSVGDTFMRINNWPYYDTSASGAAPWNYTAPGPEAVQYTQATRYHLTTYGSPRNIPLDPNPPVADPNNASYYLSDGCYTIFKVWPRQLNLEIGSLIYVDYLFQKPSFNLDNSYRWWNIVGGNATNIHFNFINYNSDRTWIKIPCLDGIVVSALPTTQLYNGRKVVIGGEVISYDINNGGWGYNIIESVLPSSNPIIDSFIGDPENVYSIESDRESKIGPLRSNDYVPTVLYSLNHKVNLDKLECLRYYPIELTSDVYRQVPQYNLQPSLVNLIPNRNYSLSLRYLASDWTLNSIGLTISTTGNIRLIDIDGVQNTRDIGGWKCTNGYVRYGVIFRGGTLNTVRSGGIYTLVNNLGVYSEIDLDGNINYSILNSTSDSDLTSNIISTGIIESVDNPPITVESEATNPLQRVIGARSTIANIVNYSAYPNLNLQNTTSGSNWNDPDQITYVKEIFEDIARFLLLNSSGNYIKSLYIHCLVGRDKTGTIIALILGLLGVSDSDILKEYDISYYYSFASNEIFSKFVRFLLDVKGSYSTFAEGAEYYLQSICGVEGTAISTIRTVLIQEN